jgi:hypothetical protein
VSARTLLHVENADRTDPVQVPFLATLGLKTIISLTPEFPTKQLLTFTRNAGIDFVSPSRRTGPACRASSKVAYEVAASGDNTLETNLGLETHPG